MDQDWKRMILGQQENLKMSLNSLMTLPRSMMAESL